jgi:hypothetical protein
MENQDGVENLQRGFRHYSYQSQNPGMFPGTVIPVCFLRSRFRDFLNTGILILVSILHFYHQNAHYKMLCLCKI